MRSTIDRGAVAGPEVVRRGKRLIARPRAGDAEQMEIDVAKLIEEERDLVSAELAAELGLGPLRP